MVKDEDGHARDVKEMAETLDAADGVRNFVEFFKEDACADANKENATR